jgi:hypothetical protein
MSKILLTDINTFLNFVLGNWIWFRGNTHRIGTGHLDIFIYLFVESKLLIVKKKETVARYERNGLKITKNYSFSMS